MKKKIVQKALAAATDGEQKAEVVRVINQNDLFREAVALAVAIKREEGRLRIGKTYTIEIYARYRRDRLEQAQKKFERWWKRYGELLPLESKEAALTAAGIEYALECAMNISLTERRLAIIKKARDRVRARGLFASDTAEWLADEAATLTMRLAIARIEWEYAGAPLDAEMEAILFKQARDSIRQLETADKLFSEPVKNRLTEAA